MKKGTITKVDWMNPHVFFYIDVKDDSGKIANWAFEMGPPQAAGTRGWKKSTMKEGDEVIVSGTLAKDGGEAWQRTLRDAGQHGAETGRSFRAEGTISGRVVVAKTKRWRFEVRNREIVGLLLSRPRQ